MVKTTIRNKLRVVPQLQINQNGNQIKDDPSSSKIFSVEFNPNAKNIDEMINIEPYNNYRAFAENKWPSIELHNCDNHKKRILIGVRECHASAWALACSFLKIHFREYPKSLKSIKTVFK